MSLLLNLFKVCGNPDANPYHTLKGSRSLLLGFFKVCGDPGSRPLSLSLSKFCGNPDATLPHFEEVEVIFALSFYGLWKSRCNPITL